MRPLGRGAWHLLSPELQRVLRDQYGAPRRLSALTVWLRFERIARDLTLAGAPKPLSALRPIRRLIERGEFPKDYADRIMRPWAITDRQARKVWRERDRGHRIVPQRDMTLYEAASKNFDILRALALAGRRIYIPKPSRIDQDAMVEAYLKRAKDGQPRPIAIAALARRFHCSARYVRSILQKRNL